MFVNISKIGSKPVALDDTPLGSGGEGKVYRINHAASPYDDSIKQKLWHLVVKIYAKPLERKNKIEFMVNNPPAGTGLGQINPDLIWPIDIVSDSSNQFVGITMPLAGQGAIPLTSFEFTSQIAPKHGQQWRKFDHGEPGSFVRRLQILKNIAHAMHKTHQMNKYVFVDAKPANIMVKPNGLIELIDIDSVQVSEGSRKLFSALVKSTDFAPPEFHRGDVEPETHIVAKPWDYFSFAVIAYKLLNGIHPFAGSHNNPDFHDIDGAIKHNYFPHGRNADKFIKLPPPHNNFNQLPDAFKNIFIRTFDDGHDDPDKRLTFTDWINAFDEAIHNPKNHAINTTQNFDVVPTPPVPPPPPEVFESEHMTATAWNIIEKMEGMDVTIGRVIHLEWRFEEPAKFFRISHYHGLNPTYPTSPVIFDLFGSIPLIVTPPRSGHLWFETAEDVTFKLSARLMNKKWFSERLKVPFVPAMLSHDSVPLNRRTVRLSRPLRMHADHILLSATMKLLHKELPINASIKHLTNVPSMHQAVLPVCKHQEPMHTKEIPLSKDIIGMVNHQKPIGWHSALQNNPLVGWLQTKISKKDRYESKQI